MPNGGIIQDLDDWLLKLDNLQRVQFNFVN